MDIRRLGSISYQEAWTLQLELLEARATGKISDTLLLLEHPHVITYGKRSTEKDSPPVIAGVQSFAVERGGESTYHGPGQLVAYPIFLIPERVGAFGFLRILEKVIITILEKYGIAAYTTSGKTGVWLRDIHGNEKKIASLGIALRKNVSYHGLALNISTDLSYFQLIKPCGFLPSVMTSMQEIMGNKTPSMLEVEEDLAEALRAHSSS